MMDIAIIGAGLTGLTTATLLKNYSNVTVFEKARGVSGRMSTRRADAFYFDHGAQYFTARTPAFKNFISPLIQAGVIERWNARYCKFDSNSVIERHSWLEGEPKYVGASGMNAICRHLANDLNISVNTRINSLKREDKWKIWDEDRNELGSYEWVISTAPAPQTTILFPQEFKHYAELSAVKMLACYAVMLGFKDDIDLGFDAAHIENSNVSWLAQNSSKPQRGSPPTVMIHSSHEYAHENLTTDPDAIMQTLTAEASRLSLCDLSKADHQTLHRWLYANNATRQEGSIMLDNELNLAACGDWNMGGRVEGAFSSAHRLVEILKDKIL